VVKFEGRSRSCGSNGTAALRYTGRVTFPDCPPKKSREWLDVTFFCFELASCLGTKRGLMQWDRNPRVRCYNERDAARVSADLKRADEVRFDLQKSVFDGFWLRIGRARRRR
jgi:hypothetical protein